MVSRNKIDWTFGAYRREVMIALCLTKLSGTDFRVIIFLLAQTDGYRRTEDKIKPAFFEERTDLSRANVRRTIARLRGWHMISKQGHIYTVLPPGQWDKEVFAEQERFNIEALSTTNGEGNRFKSEAQVEAGEEANRFNSEAEEKPEEEGNRFNPEAQTLGSQADRFKSEAPTASNLKRQEVKSEAVLASSKENLSKENPSKENLSVVYDHWSSQHIIEHKKLTDPRKRALKIALKDHSEEELCQAITNYAEIVHGDGYWFDYRWTLEDFLRRGLEKFIDGEVARSNYRREKGVPHGQSEPVRRQERARPITYIRGAGEGRPGKED